MKIQRLSSRCGLSLAGSDDAGKGFAAIADSPRRDASATKTCRADAGADGQDAGGNRSA